MRFLFIWLTYTIGSIGDLSFAASGIFESRGPQAGDPDTSLIDPLDAQFDNPSLELSKGMEDIAQVPENSIEGNQKVPTASIDSTCRSRRGDNRKRDQPDDCQNVAPLHLQHQENGRPSGTLNQDQPARDNFILPAKSIPEWAPSVHDFFETDPCNVRPYQVCAPYLPGLEFSAWSFGRLAGFDLEGCDYCMYGDV